MFGWIDRRHPGWLARFMQRLPVFPFPGFGRLIPQPLFVSDFCRLIQPCLEDPSLNGCYDITRDEKVSCINLMRQIVHRPVPVLGWLLQFWFLISRQAALTKGQLKATPAAALHITNRDCRCRDVVLPYE